MASGGNRQKTEATGSARLGPRPLPLHLTGAMATWLSSQGALPLLSSGSPFWKEPETPLRGPLAESESLLEALASADPEALGQAVAREARHRMTTLLAGIEAYRRHPYRRALPDMPLLWQQGTTKLRDYRKLGRSGRPPGRRSRAPVVLVVPSLINRFTVLDLSERVSFLRWLQAQGARPFVVDWDAPGEAERGFTLTDYIAGRLEAALSAVVEETGRRPVLAGYCMGGDLALALALRRQRDLAGLILMATPWDFHAASAEQARCLGTSLVTLEPVMALMGALPVDCIQALFSALDPLLVARKFMAFSRLDPAGPEAAAFVALEDWLNDGVDLAAPVARDCLAGWYGANATGKGAWRIAGEPVAPQRLALPTLVVVPGRDRIVPPASANALAELIPGADAFTPGAGHIGMMASSRAPQRVWPTLLTWLKERAAAAR